MSIKDSNKSTEELLLEQLIKTETQLQEYKLMFDTKDYDKVGFEEYAWAWFLDKFQDKIKMNFEPKTQVKDNKLIIDGDWVKSEVLKEIIKENQL